MVKDAQRAAGRVLEISHDNRLLMPIQSRVF